MVSGAGPLPDGVLFLARKRKWSVSLPFFPAHPGKYRPLSLEMSHLNPALRWDPPGAGPRNGPLMDSRPERWMEAARS